MSIEAEFAETQAARNAWEELGERNQLLPPEHFQDRLAPPEAYYDDTSHWPDPGPRRTRTQSQALQDVVNGCCQGWVEPPTGAELYNAFRAEKPTERELGLLRTWFIEATIGQLFEAWAQQAYTHRELVKSIHRIGFTRTDLPVAAYRIRIINTWAIR